MGLAPIMGGFAAGSFGLAAGGLAGGAGQAFEGHYSRLPGRPEWGAADLPEPSPPGLPGLRWTTWRRFDPSSSPSARQANYVIEFVYIVLKFIFFPTRSPTLSFIGWWDG